MCFWAKFSGNLGLESSISLSKVQAHGPAIPKFPYKHFDMNVEHEYVIIPENIYSPGKVTFTWITIDGALKSSLGVAVSRENDTCSGNGLVMGYAECKYFAGFVETSK